MFWFIFHVVRIAEGKLVEGERVHVFHDATVGWGLYNLLVSEGLVEILPQPRVGLRPANGVRTVMVVSR